MPKIVKTKMLRLKPHAADPQKYKEIQKYNDFRNRQMSIIVFTSVASSDRTCCQPLRTAGSFCAVLDGISHSRVVRFRIESGIMERF